MPPLIEPWKFVVVTIAQEALLEPYIGKVAVAEVIRDRTESGFHSDGTLVGTVLAPKQFSGWNDEEWVLRIRMAAIDITDSRIVDCIRAYEEAFFKRTNYAMGANLYHADYMNPYPSWTKSLKVKRLTQIEHHIFYKEER
jgi:spore germination cell wall hydrolase CwlJ-like protein